MARQASHLGGERLPIEKGIQVAVARVDLFLSQYGEGIVVIITVCVIILLILAIGEKVRSP